MDAANVSIVIGSVVTLLGAVGAIYKALTTRQTDLERRQEALNVDRANRLQSLEEYMRDDIRFHHRFRANIFAQLEAQGVKLDLDSLPIPPTMPNGPT